ncbi:MAG TPA: OmpA family protein [Rectinemataceae bacterium]|nr:OmpA family protein [Rectinemataceae bacterium]
MPAIPRRASFLLFAALGSLTIQAQSSAQAQAADSTPDAPAAAAAKPFVFAYDYHKGDKFRVLSEVSEDIYVNHVLAKRAEIMNRIAFEVADTAPDKGAATLAGTFVTSERAKGETNYIVTGQYDSKFTQSRLGLYSIDDSYFMPVVRDVPSFPDHPVSPGDTWTAPGEERHDMRQGFGIPEPYAIPFVAEYRYEGPETKDGRPVQRLSARYTIFYEPPVPSQYNDSYPVQISGFSDQKIWWDPVYAQPTSYEERFKIVLDLSNGTTIEYRGTAKSSFVEATLMDRQALKSEVEKAVGDLEGVSVKTVPEGVAITLEDVQFTADSAALDPAELGKIASIAEYLKAHPERDIIVAGHTALAGTAEARLALSIARARAVADRLVTLGARDPLHIQVEGFGAERPISDNSTPEGMARNRRVEIIIREN